MERGKNVADCDKVEKSDSQSLDDSLADFKSPKSEPVLQTSSKIKIVNDRRGKKVSGTAKKKTSGKKQKKEEIAQQSIESSFFKDAISRSKEGHTCPLCMRYFSDAKAGKTHSKNCAVKNNVSTKKLLAATDLQERQANERIAIGLPVGPLLQSKEKTSQRNRVAGSKKDPDLQLALALSKSLQETQLENEYEEALLLASEHSRDAPILGMTDSERRKTLKNFGFLTNKSASASAVSEGPVKSRRKKHLGPTILQTRSQESRNRILSERVAEVLMGNEAITQVCSEESAEKPVRRQSSILKSRLLNEIHETTKRLWDSAQLSRTVTNFYVKDLESVVLPDSQLKLKNSSSIMKIDDVKKMSGDEKNDFPSESSRMISKLDRIHKIERRSEGSNNIDNVNQEFCNLFALDWANTLNVSSMSDVIVFVKNNHIWVHKLVFHVRCSEILLDCEANDDERFPKIIEKISWPDIDFLTGLAFLEFVYSGVIVKNSHIFTDDRIATGVRVLARKYRLKSLFDYLRKRQAEIACCNEAELKKKDDSPIKIKKNEPQFEEKTLEDRDSIKEEIQIDNELSISASCEKSDEFAVVDSKISIQQNIEDGQKTDRNIVAKISTGSGERRSTMSPDLFDDLEDSQDSVIKNQSRNSEKSGKNSQGSFSETPNLEVLAQLVAEDDFSSFEKINAESTISMSMKNKFSEDFTVNEEVNESWNSSQTQVETPKSRRVSLVIDTPKRCTEEPRSQRLTENNRRNFSSYLEKIKKMNALSASESCSDVELEVNLPVRKRNPFRVNDSNETLIMTYALELPTKNTELGDLECAIKRNNEIKKIFQKSTPRRKTGDFNETSQTTPDALEEEFSTADESVDMDDNNISMFSNYKKNHKHDNSISKYRKFALNKVTESAAIGSSDDDEKNENNSSTNLTIESDAENNLPASPALIKRKIGSCDSDSDSMNARLNKAADYKKTNLSEDDEKRADSDNSVSLPRKRKIDRAKIKNRRSLMGDLERDQEEIPKKCAKKSPEFCDLDILDADEQIFTHNSKNSQISSRDTISHLSDHSSVAADKFVTNRRRKNVDKRKESSIFLDKLTENDETKKEKNCWEKTSQGTKSPINLLDYPDSNVDEQIYTQKSKNLELVTEDIESNFSVGLSFPDSDVFDAYDEIFTGSFDNPQFSPRENYDKESESSKMLRLPSPILISSSPELNGDSEKCVKNTENDFNKENACNRNVSPLFSRELASPEPGTSREEFPPLRHDFSPRRNKLSPRRQELSPRRRKISPMKNLKKPKTNSLQRWNSMPTSTLNNKEFGENRHKQNKTPKKSSRMVFSQDVTPPINYNEMDTPELKKELEKYGIKPQKRNRARQLLTHIYNELHPVVPITSSTNLATDCVDASDDEEPPSKKSGKIGRTSKESESDEEKSLSQESNASVASLIPEEMEFADVDTSPRKISSASNIKEAFLNLIKVDKQLHNKVLTYEPLPLESLHLMLKNGGFKCKINDLMDFLDEECITFQVQGQSSRKKNSKARGKKSGANGTRKANSQK